MSLSFKDGLKSLVNALTNRRSALGNNIITGQRLSISIQRDLVKNGTYRRIVDLKAGHATKAGFNFDDDKSQAFYKEIEYEVKFAVRDMITYGRGVIVLIDDDELYKPLASAKRIKKIKAFGGDMVTAVSASFHLLDERYMKPDFYQIREKQVHHTRVIDFTYVQPPELELPIYFYGGISEAEFIYPQLLADATVERAVPSILEKSATMFYKIDGFDNAMKQHNEDDIIKFFGTLEDARSMYGAGVVDKTVDIEVHQQTLTNLQESALITLQRIAFVTSIPLTILLGEGNKGLSSDNATEKQVFNEMIETLQTEFILPPLGNLMELMGYKRPSILIGQNISPLDKANFEGIILENAIKIYNMGGDPDIYLNENGIINIDEDFTHLDENFT